MGCIAAVAVAKRGDVDIATKYLRHGTPTYEPAMGALVSLPAKFFSFFSSSDQPLNTFITPEFRVFLEELEIRKSPFLYVNHQTNPGDWDRLIAIKNEEQLFPSFHFLSLPIGDGKIFSEKDGLLAEENTETFKLQLYNALANQRLAVTIDDKEYTYGTKELGIILPEMSPAKNAAFQQMLKEVIPKIHGLYFRNNDQLNVQEKLAFISILFFYTKMHF